LARPEGLEAEGDAECLLGRGEVGHDGSLGQCSIFVPKRPQGRRYT
jgi:hypothetical protein